MAHIFFADMECNSVDEFNSIATNNGTVAASNEQAKTGTYSLKSNITIAGGHAYAKFHSWTTAMSHAELYVRDYYYLPTATYNTMGNVNDEIIIFYDSTPLFYTYIKNVAGTIGLYYDYGPGADNCVCPSRDVWHCVEIYHKRDAANGAWEWWIDGVSEGSGAGINTGAANAKELRFGITNSVGTTGALYQDNIVVSTSRIYELMGNIPADNSLRARVESPQGWII